MNIRPISIQATPIRRRNNNVQNTMNNMQTPSFGNKSSRLVKGFKIALAGGLFISGHITGRIAQTAKIMEYMRQQAKKVLIEDTKQNSCPVCKKYYNIFIKYAH